MIPLTDPWLRAAIDSNAPRDQIVDFLQDRECSLGNLLALFAGVRPKWEHVVDLGTVARWLEVMMPEEYVRVRGFKEIQAQKPTLPNWARTPYRNDAVFVFIGYSESPPLLHGSRLYTACPICDPTKQLGRTFIDLRESYQYVPFRSYQYVPFRVLFVGQCRACHTVCWTTEDMRPDMVPVKRRVLSLFPTVTCPDFLNGGEVAAPDLIPLLDDYCLPD